MTNVSVETTADGKLNVVIDVSGATTYSVEIRNYQTASMDIANISGGGGGDRTAHVSGPGGGGASAFAASNTYTASGNAPGGGRAGGGGLGPW